MDLLKWRTRFQWFQPRKPLIQNKMYLFMITLLLAVAGVVIFHLANIPLAWLLGPITAITLYKCFCPQSLYWPVSLRNTGLTIIGFTLGASFSLEIMSELLIHLPAMFVSTLLMIGFSVWFAYIMSRKTDIDFLSSLLGSIPGGLSYVLVLSDGLRDVNMPVIVFMQITRVLFVIFLIPFIALWLYEEGLSTDSVTQSMEQVAHVAAGEWIGYLVIIAICLWIARRVQLPSPYLMGPIMGTMVMSVWNVSAPLLPDSFFMFAQFALGAHIGLQIEPKKLFQLKSMGKYLVVSNVLLIVLGILISLGLSWIYPISFHTGFLGTAPGGIAEMGVTAKAVQADLAIVTGYQLFRLFFILFLFTVILKWWIRKID